MFFRLSQRINKVLSRKARKRPKARLCIELLEDRLAPTISWWTGNISDSWDDTNNWSAGKPGVDAGVDEAVFDGVNNSPCSVDVAATLKSITINDTFSATITLNNNLTIKDQQDNVISTMAGGTLDKGVGMFGLTIEKGTFDWSGGTWSVVGATVNQDGKLNVKGNVTLNCSLTNNGTININGGNLKVAPQKIITNNLFGTIDLQDNSSISHVADLPLGTLNNSGTVQKTGSGGSLIDVDFTNNKNFRIESGGVTFLAKAEQNTGGTTTLFNGTNIFNALSSTEKYVINDGIFTGAGDTRIYGNLEVKGGDVYPGGDGVIGTLQVDIYKQTGGTLNIDNNLDSATNDKLIAGAAILGGKLKVRTITLENKKPSGKYQIIPYGNLFESFSDPADGKIPIQGTTKYYRLLPDENPSVYQLQVFDEPKIGGLNPNNGPAIGGTVSTITGEGFTGVTDVRFGDVAATNFTVDSDTQITVTSPPNIPSVVDVTVTNEAGTSDATSADRFTYLGPLAVNDQYSMFRGQSLVIPADIGLLANDSNPENGSPFRISSASEPSNGSLTLNDDGSFTFTPGSTFTGTATFTYQVNDSYFDSNVATVSISVRAAVSTTVLSSNHNPAVYGQSITFTVQVSTSDTGAGTPTGTATFYAGSSNNPLGTETLDGNGRATLSTADLPLGTTSIWATYSGDATFSASTSNTVAQVVNAANTTVTLTSSQPNPGYGTTLSFTATLSVDSPGGGQPAGTIYFLDGNVQIGAFDVDHAGSVTLQIATLSVGTHGITASFMPANSNFNTSSDSISQLVNQGTSVTLASSNPNPSTYGQNVTLSAQVAAGTGSSGTPAGWVKFYSDGNLLGQAELDGNGLAQLTVNTELTAGYHTLTAVYQGSTNFGSSSSDGIPQTVSKADTTTTVTPSATSADYGTQLTFTAAIGVQSPGGGTPSGMLVHFFDDGVEIGTGVVVNGQTSFSTSILSVGSHAITAHFDGDGNYNGSDAQAIYVTIS